MNYTVCIFGQSKIRFHRCLKNKIDVFAITFRQEVKEFKGDFEFFEAGNVRSHIRYTETSRITR